MHPNENKSCYDPEKQDSKKGLGKLGLSDHKYQVKTGKSWFQNRSDIYMAYRKVDLIAVLSKSQVRGSESRLRACPPKFVDTKEKSSLPSTLTASVVTSS